MAGGPIFPHSAFPATADRIFQNFHVGAGANSKRDEGLGFEASVGADSTWELRFQCPPTLPSGTGRLQIIALANATTGDGAWDVQWASVAAEEDPSSTALQSEGITTITWGAGDADQYKRATVTLDATALTANETVVMNFIAKTTAWTLAQVCTASLSLIWED